ncbi:MAG: ATP-binding cassette domain-containing protein, partial [Leuconostoc lactis]
MGIIETKDFGVRYGEKVIFSDANIDIPAGRFFAILGENGAGKTSFVKALIGQNVQTVGQLSRQVKRIGFVPQFR